MLRKSNISLSNRALFYPNRKNTLPSHEELQNSNVTKRYLSKGRTANLSFSNLPKLRSDRDRGEFRNPIIIVRSQTFEEAVQSNKSNEITVTPPLFSRVRSGWPCFAYGGGRRGLRTKMVNTQLKSNQQNKVYLRRAFLMCSRPVGPTELRSTNGSNASSTHSTRSEPKGLDHPWLLRNTRDISRQWLEKVGFTFSPVAFIFGTTFLFAGLASTLQKQAGKQWLQTLSHAKLPGLTENKVSQISSWVFIESVLSQYINRDNSLLVSTTAFSQDQPYSAKLRKVMPRTLSPFLDQQEVAQHRRSLSLAPKGGANFRPTGRLAKVSESALSEADQATSLQIQLSPLWSQHLKKDFLGVFPLRRTYSAAGRSEKGFATLGLSNSSERSLNKSKIGLLPERSSSYPNHLLSFARRGFVKPPQSVTDQSSRITPELKTTLTWPWYKITAYHPPNRFIVPTWNHCTTIQANASLLRSESERNSLSLGDTPPGLDPKGPSFPRPQRVRSLIDRTINKSKLYSDNIIGVSYQPSKGDQCRTLIRAKSTRTDLQFVNGAVEYAPKKIIQADSTTLNQINFNPDSLSSRAPNWFFSPKSNEQDFFGSVNIGIERLRLEDDSIPSKKYSIYSKKKIHQDTLSSRVLNVVKKSFYDYGLSIPCTAQPSALVAARTRATLELPPSYLHKLVDSKTDGAEVRLPSNDCAESDYALVVPQREQGTILPGLPSNQSKGADAPKVTGISFRQPQALPERANLSEAEYEYDPVSVAQPSPAQSFLAPATLVAIADQSSRTNRNSVSAISSNKPGKLGLMYTNIALPKKGFWEYAHYISGYNFPELQDYEVADLFGSKLRFDRAPKPLKITANQVFLTPYLVKVPPKLLLAVSNKTERLNPQKTAPCSSSKHEAGLGRRERPLVQGFTIRYTPLDLNQENKVKKAFKELGRDYSDYLKQPKDSLPALLLSPSLEEDKQIEEEEFQRLAQEKAAAKVASKRTQNDEESNISNSTTIEEELIILDPLEVSLREGKNNINNLEEEPLNDEEIEDSKFERLRFTRELETKKEEEECRGVALSLTRPGLNSPMGCLEEMGQTKPTYALATTQREQAQPELRSGNFVRARSNSSGSTPSKPALRFLLSKSEHEQELVSIRRPSIAQFAAKKVEPKVSDRKHSFFGQRSFWPTRLFAQEERLLSGHVVNPYIRYDQRNPWLISEQIGVLPVTSQTNRTANCPTYDADSMTNTRAVNNPELSADSILTLQSKASKIDDLQNLKNLQTQARLGLVRFVDFPVVEAANSSGDRVTVTHKTSNQNRIYKSDPRLRLTPLESSLSADWRQDRKVEASPFRVTSKDRVHIVLPQLSENQWQKSIEWQLKRHFLDEDKRLESLVATEPYKRFKVRKIERSLPWLTLAGTKFRLTPEGPKNSSFKLFQWPYRTVGEVSFLGSSVSDSASSVTGGTTTPSSTADSSSVITRDKGLFITFFEEGSTIFSPFRLLNYSRIPLASSFTTYSKDSSSLSASSNPLFDRPKKLFSNQNDLNTELLFEAPSISSWFLIYRLFLALILKEVFKYIYRISLKDFFIRIINSDFGRTITSPEFRQSVQFSPFPEFYKPKNRLNDLIGIKNALLPLSEIIWFLRNNCRSRNGPHGVILLGPEGVDTTAIAQAVAGEAKVPIIVQSLRALTLTHSHPQKRLEKVLRLARAQSPCVLFLDELDVIGQSREGVIRKTSGDGNSLISLDSSTFAEGQPQLQSPEEQATSQGRRVDLMLRLLTVMDGLHHLNGVVIITTSKNTATLDPALLRPGRFDRIIRLTLPDHEQRMELFKTKTRGLGQTYNLSLVERSCLRVEELEYLSVQTANMSGADIVSAINYSTLRAIVNDTVHTLDTLEYGLNCVKALKDKQGRRNRLLVATQPKR